MRKLWWLSGGIWAVAISAGAFIGNQFLVLPNYVPLLVSAIAVVVETAFPVILYRRWRYEIRERDVFLSRGALFWRLTLVPFDRIQFVESRQGPLERRLKLAEVIIYTAAGRAASIPGLNVTDAERLREQLSSVAGTESV